MRKYPRTLRGKSKAYSDGYMATFDLYGTDSVEILEGEVRLADARERSAFWKDDAESASHWEGLEGAHQALRDLVLVKRIEPLCLRILNEEIQKHKTRRDWETIEVLGWRRSQLQRAANYAANNVRRDDSEIDWSAIR